jgi:hypothetical protein
MVQKAGCRGTIGLSKVESFQLVETGGYVWLKPTSAFYATLHLSQTALALVAEAPCSIRGPHEPRSG